MILVSKNKCPLFLSFLFETTGTAINKNGNFVQNTTAIHTHFHLLFRGSFRISNYFFLLLLLLMYHCSYRHPLDYEGLHERKQNPERISKKAYDCDQKELTGNNSKFPDVPEKFKNEIQKFWGVPYTWGGASPKGTDCSGLIVALFKNAFGLSLPHSTKGLYQLGERVSSHELRFGDLIFFNNGKGTNPTHVGIFITRNIFLHASIRDGVSMAKLDKPPYNKQFIGARRLYLKENKK
jgi:probable lipoprotein NlpC